MTGNFIKVYIDDTVIAASTSCEVSLQRGVLPYTALPGTSEDDGWMRYKPGARAWSVSVDGLYGTDHGLIDDIIDGNVDVSLKVDLDGEGYFLGGTALMSEVSVMAEVHAISKFTAKFLCNDFPDITT